MPELMDIVDESNKVKGTASRKEIHSRGLWHRGVHVLVFNDKGEMLLQKRAPDKDKYPNCYDISLSEHLKAGEDFLNAALRGLKEELDIEGVKLKRLLRFRMRYGKNDNTIAEIYICRYKGKIKTDKNEVSEIGFFQLEKIKRMLKEEGSQFAFWSREILRWVFNMPSKMEALDDGCSTPLVMTEYSG